MSVVLYSTGCPQCRVLKQKLDKTGVKYEIVTDEQVLLDKGFRSAPILEVDGKYLTFSEANRWVNEQNGGK